ncbi:MAG: type II toxin-antitoxin system VapC family toxin [Candidatus Bathyarchaeia archaeon]
MIFTDTSAWYAYEVPDDMNHSKAREFAERIRRGEFGSIITSDYVLDESLTLLRMRRGLHVSSAFIKKVLSSESVTIIWVDGAIFNKALEMFLKSEKEAWTFTDCTSFTIMRQLKIADAFAFDENFKEAGFTTYP